MSISIHQSNVVRKPKSIAEVAKRRYASTRWRNYSRRYIRAHPMCVHCPDTAAHTDHIVPVSSDCDPMFWAPTNHQALCAACHGRKTRAEQLAQRYPRVQAYVSKYVMPCYGILEATT